jgi:hypothetical protein
MQEVPHLFLNNISLWLNIITSESNYSLDSKSGFNDRYDSHCDILSVMFLTILISKFGFPESAVSEAYIDINELLLK